MNVANYLRDATINIVVDLLIGKAKYTIPTLCEIVVLALIARARFGAIVPVKAVTLNYGLLFRQQKVNEPFVIHRGLFDIGDTGAIQCGSHDTLYISSRIRCETRHITQYAMQLATVFTPFVATGIGFKLFSAIVANHLYFCFPLVVIGAITGIVFRGARTRTESLFSFVGTSDFVSFPTMLAYLFGRFVKAPLRVTFAHFGKFTFVRTITCLICALGCSKKCATTYDASGLDEWRLPTFIAAENILSFFTPGGGHVNRPVAYLTGV